MCSTRYFSIIYQPSTYPLIWIDSLIICTRYNKGIKTFALLSFNIRKESNCVFKILWENFISCSLREEFSVKIALLVENN